MKKKNKKSDFRFWRYLINFWSIILFTVAILDFYYRNVYKDFLNILAVVYISALAIYVSNKEFERWYDKHESKHPGEMFVIILTILILVLFALNFFYRGEYEVPSSIISSYIAVLTILAVTRKSKEIYEIKRSHKK